jgi:hypothetical protein
VCRLGALGAPSLSGAQYDSAAKNLFRNERRGGWRRIVDAVRRTRAQSMLEASASIAGGERRRETVPSGRRAFRKRFHNDEREASSAQSP